MEKNFAKSHAVRPAAGDLFLTVSWTLWAVLSLSHPCTPALYTEVSVNSCEQMSVSVIVIKLYLWMLKCGFHIAFVSHNVILFATI